jgi:hypothetical protein
MMEYSKISEVEAFMNAELLNIGKKKPLNDYEIF